MKNVKKTFLLICLSTLLVAGCKENNVEENRQAYEDSRGSGTTTTTTTTSSSADYTFEIGSSTSGITQSSGSDASWYRSSRYARNGSYSYRSGTIGDNEESCFQITRNSNSGYFYHRTSSESSYDYLKFYIDGVLKFSTSGVVSYWSYKSFSTTYGSHTFKWCYEKDSSRTAGDDSIYIDDINFN